jgi:Pyruvate/2-oxoacid:ferredoxin oxidoreductase delta subunit
MAAGKRAAWGIDILLRGREVASRRQPPPLSRRPAVSDLPKDPSLARIDRDPRQHPEELPSAERTSFAENVASLTEEAARAEAARCAICGQCGNCRACLDLFGCPAFFLEDGLVEIDSALCNGCGICAAFCPNGAIVPLEEVAP